MLTFMDQKTGGKAGRQEVQSSESSASLLGRPKAGGRGAAGQTLDGIATGVNVEPVRD